MTTRIALPLLTLLATASVSFECRAVGPLDTFSVRLGGYITEFDTEVRADGETGTGTEIDLERDLGLDQSNTIAFAGLTWRPFDNHEFGLSYHENDADSSRTINRQIEFDGSVYEVNSTVRAEFDMEAYDVYYVWWAANNERWALGPRLGVVWYRTRFGLTLQADASGNPATATVSEEIDADLPAPTIGGSWRWAPHEQWRFSADAGYFSADVDNVDADVTYGRIGAEWFPWERAGVSLDYTLTRIQADASRADFLGNLDFVDSGLRLGFVYRF